MVNYFGVQLGGRVQVALRVVKIMAVAAVIVIGFSLGKGTIENFRTAYSSAGRLGFTAALLFPVYFPQTALLAAPLNVQNELLRSSLSREKGFTATR